MAKTIVFFNNKGGVGKTTLACNVVSFLNMHRNTRVLLVDADPQCNATQSILSDELLDTIYVERNSAKKTLYSYLQPLELGEASINLELTPILGSENNFRTDLIPGHPKMSLVEDRLSQAWSDLQGADQIRGYRISNWLSQLLSPVSRSYDLVVFDVGPSLGALNRTILLNSDFIVTPFGSDIFSLLGIENISDWINRWADDYTRALENIKRRHPEGLSYPGVQDISDKFRIAGYSVQQYVMRTFKEGKRPVRAYDEIMKGIPTTIVESLSSFFPTGVGLEDLALGHIPFLYSLVPIAQSNRMPIHVLADNKAVVGSQVRQVAEYEQLMNVLCDRLLANIGAGHRTTDSND